MSLDTADPSLPAPLRDVLAYEGVRVPRVGTPRAVAPGADGPGAEGPAAGRVAAPTAVRWEVFGLPGLGKSTLCRALAARLHAAGAPALYLPEAVPYAVRVLGIRLADLEPFLDRVNAQAEALATAFVAADARTTDAAVPDSRDAGRRAAPGRGSPGHAEPRVVLRDPAHVQNESYRYVLHARRDEDALAALLPAVATAAARGRWDEAVAAEFGRALVARHPAMRAAPRGAWRLGHLVLTTGDPLEDLALSARRQRTPERDPGLVTDDPVTLTGYLAAIRAAEARTRVESGAARLILDPRRPAADLVDELEAATTAAVPQAAPALRPDAPPTSEGRQRGSAA